MKKELHSTAMLEDTFAERADAAARIKVVKATAQQMADRISIRPGPAGLSNPEGLKGNARFVNFAMDKRMKVITEQGKDPRCLFFKLRAW